MTYLYGFEIEGFDTDSSTHNIIIPSNRINFFDKDGFPGLVEVRTSGGNSCIHQAGFELLKEMAKYPSVRFDICEHIFSGEEKNKLRREQTTKRSVEINNIYGKSPRLLGNKTIASFQINISNRLADTYRNKDGVMFPPTYGLLDINKIVRNLDKLFEVDIKNSKRQPGFYAIKDNGIRLEYRSLPNYTMADNMYMLYEMLTKIKNAVEAKN